jgi:hypothetical protein
MSNCRNGTVSAVFYPRIAHLAAFATRLTTADDAHRGALGAFVNGELVGLAHYEFAAQLTACNAEADPSNPTMMDGHRCGSS